MGMKLLGQEVQFVEGRYERVRDGQMSITFWVNSRMTVSLMEARNWASVWSWDLGTSWSSLPASAKCVVRKSFRAVLLVMGLASLAKAVCISSRGLIAGLGG